MSLYLSTLLRFTILLYRQPYKFCLHSGYYSSFFLIFDLSTSPCTDITNMYDKPTACHKFWHLARFYFSLVLYTSISPVSTFFFLGHPLSSLSHFSFSLSPSPHLPFSFLYFSFLFSPYNTGCGNSYPLISIS